LTCLY